MQKEDTLIQNLNAESTWSQLRIQQRLAPPNDMVSSSELTYDFDANLRGFDLSAPNVDLNAYAWVQVTVIDDTDLTYRDKPLSLWFEEERRRCSGGGDGSDSGTGSEGRRGRKRTERSIVTPSYVG